MALSLLASGPLCGFSAPLAAGSVQRASVSMQLLPETPKTPDYSLPIPFLPRPPMLDGSMPGDIGFDPLRLSEIVPIKWAREAELKHARVCMLAVAGWVSVDLGFRVPYAPEVSSLYAHDATVEKGPMYVLLLVCSAIEICAGVPKVFQLLNDPDAAPPGDFKFDPLGFGGSKDLQEKELANGRLAMMAFSGIVTQSALTGNSFPYTFNGAVDMVPPLGMTALPGICASGLANYCS